MARFSVIGLALAGATLTAAMPALAQISIGISVNLAPPPLPVYVQPPLPGPDFIWTPGYWAWDDDADAYFWVPGTWVRAPRPGLLWTPPWWGWSDGVYVFHSGYWGPHVGFYGGVPYGFGYTGFGFQGGYWSGGHVAYNSAVTNVTNVKNVTNIYHTTIVENHVTRVSYNGGPGGVQARPSAEQQVAMRETHIAPTPNQQTHVAAARNDPRLLASVNHGRPPIATTPRPLATGGGRDRPGGAPSAPDAITRTAQPRRGDPRQAASDREARIAAPDDAMQPTVDRGGRPPEQERKSHASDDRQDRGDPGREHAAPRPAPHPAARPAPPRPHPAPRPQGHPHPPGPS